MHLGGSGYHCRLFLVTYDVFIDKKYIFAATIFKTG
jgi:hypothetical protein